MTFRVQRAFLDNSVVLRLSGDIAGDHGLDLQALLDAERGHGLVLDLAEVAVVDRTGVWLLARIESSGARLMNCPAYVREWIDRQREGFDRHQAVSRTEDQTMTHGTTPSSVREDTFDGTGGLRIFFRTWQPDRGARGIVAIVPG